jgi:Arc/MetJ-type ribon-helix-helix transcriptional regulator
MSKTVTKQKTVRLPKDFQEFAEERVRAGKNASVEEVICDAFQEKKLRALRDALNEGLAELDAGLGEESTVEEFMAEIDAAVGLTP